jgi:hypothetical protein
MANDMGIYVIGSIQPKQKGHGIFLCLIKILSFDLDALHY